MRKIALVITLAATASLLAQSSYRITHTYLVGGDGSWDYVVPDPPNHRLFVARQNRVMVIDENSGALLGEVTGIQGAHGTAVAETTGHGFATSGNDQSAIMFDLKSFKTLSRIPAAEDADAIVYDSASNRVFTLNGDAHSSTVIDPQAGTVITNIPLGGKPEYGASAGDGKVYANLTDISEVVEIDAKTATVGRRWSTAPCKQPVSMAIDTGHHRLFSGRHAPDRRRRRWRRIRRGIRRRICLECGRHAHCDSSRHAGPISRRGNSANAGRIAQHGARPHQPSSVSGFREVWRGARRGQGQTAGATWNLYLVGDRAQHGNALRVFTISSSATRCGTANDRRGRLSHNTEQHLQAEWDRPPGLFGPFQQPAKNWQ
jgi:hypothetical protein